MTRILLPVLLFTLPFGCTDGSKSGDTGEAGDADTDTDTDTTPDPDEVRGSLSLADFATGGAISGALLVGPDGDSFTSDASGNVTFTIPKSATSEVVLSASGYLDTHLFLAADEASDWAMSFGMASGALISGVESVFGITYDATLSTVIVSVVQPDGAGGYEAAAGTVIDLDVAYQGAVVQTSDSFAPTNTLQDGGGSFVAFANAAVGTVNVTVTPPVGSVGCVTFASGTRLDAQITTYADSIAAITFICM